MQAIGSTTRAQAAPVAAGQQACARPQQGVRACSLARGSAIVKQQAARPAMLQRRLSARAAGRRQGVSVVAKAGGEVLVVGSSGQTAARVVVNLLRAGFKVTAGVDTDLEESQEVLKFAKQLEIVKASEAANLKLAEFNPLDGDSIATALKRGARVVLVVGDQAGGRRPDLRIYDAVLDALLENAGRISQLVVVTPLAGSGTRIFGAGGGGGARLSSLEQTVVDSGVPYLLVRAAPSDRVTDRYGDQANVVVAGVGGLPTGLQASRAQVAAVVAEAMAQTSGDAIIEVGASPDADADLASQVAVALADGEQEEEEEEEEEEAAPAPAKGLFFTIGGGSKKQKVVEEVEEEEEEEEEEPAPAPAKKGGFFGGFGTRKIARQPVAVVEEEEEEEEEEEPAPAPAKKGGFFNLGGTRKIARQAVEEEEEEEEEAPAPAPKRGFSFGTTSSRRQQAVAVVEEVEEEVEERAPAPRPGRIIRGRQPVAAAVEEKPVVRAQAKAEEPAAAGGDKKKGGLLGFLGIQQETVYADEA